jgi:hypothetical protein
MMDEKCPTAPRSRALMSKHHGLLKINRSKNQGSWEAERTTRQTGREAEDRGIIELQGKRDISTARKRGYRNGNVGT